MSGMVFERAVILPAEAGAVWDWHQREGAFWRLAPPWQRLVADGPPARMEAGAEFSFRIAAGPLRVRWRARIEAVEPPRRFVDTQLRGPFGHWRHEHLITPAGSGAATLTDRVTFGLPAGLDRLPWARAAALREVGRLFRFRHARMLADFERHAGRLPGAGKTVLITGSSGLIGSRLAPFLQTLGYRVRRLGRGQGGDCFRWEPARGWVDPQALDGADAVIHLAGANIAGGRWTAARKHAILASRVDGTRTLVEAMRGMARPPRVFVCASGVNIYGAGPPTRDESQADGAGFLAEVCRQWEAQAVRAAELGVRVVCVRTGVVLDPAGGALGKMLPAFRMGLGGPVGSGDQAFPWVSMDDLLDIYERALRDDALRGPVNAVHPDAVTQRQFSRCLGGILRRPARLPLPAGVVRLVFGEMGRETLLADPHARPAALLALGHHFRHAGLAEALAFMLGRA